MGISYDEKTKKWNVQYENANNPISDTFFITAQVQVRVPTYGSHTAFQTQVKEIVFNINDSQEQIIQKLEKAGASTAPSYYRRSVNVENALSAQIARKGENARNQKLNAEASANNNLYAAVYNLGSRLQQTKEPGNYLTYVKNLQNVGEGTPGARNLALTYFNNFYSNEIVSPWDQKNAAKVPFEGFQNTIRFDPNYYSSTQIGKSAKENWNKATASNDLDVIGRYPNFESYALWHYSTIGQPEAKRRLERDPGFKPITPTDGFQYLKIKETVPGKTDAERQFERDLLIKDVLGLRQTEKSYELRDITSDYANLVANNKSLQEKWNQAKAQILYSERFPNEQQGEWAKIYNAVFKTYNVKPNVTSESGFGELLTKAYNLKSSEYPNISSLIGDIQKVKDIGKIDTRLSEYDVQLSKITTDVEKIRTEKAAVLQKQFLEESRLAMLNAARKEQMFDMLSGTSFGKEILGLRENISNQLIQDSGIGGILSLTGKKSILPSEKFGIDTGAVFGSKNGILYNWEQWFFNEIEKKYSGGLDIPNDYIPPYLRKPENGFVTADQKKNWAKYDDAYNRLKTNPNDIGAKTLVASGSLPTDYVPINNRKEVKGEWLSYEEKRRAMGWADNETLAKWSAYDEALQTLNSKTASEKEKAEARTKYDARPKDYIVPEKRIQADIQFAQDFFSDYLLPRFNASKSISEFRDYIDVERKNQNIFQTEDRMTTLKNAAQASSVAWLKALESLKPTGFDSDYYFDPAGYYLQKGVGGKEDLPVLLGSNFQKEWGNALPQQYVDQRKEIETAWNLAKNNKTTKDANGNEINWQASAYLYGLDVNKKEDFAKLHFELVGRGKQYDSAPDVFNPKIAKIYLNQILSPYLRNRYEKIGTVFGQFVTPESFADEFLKNLDPLQNRPQIERALKLYGLDTNTKDLTELRNMIVESIQSGTASDIRQRIQKLNQAGETPTQELLGVQYIQRASDKKAETAKSDDALYARFKSAGYQGTVDEFYSQFMPDLTSQDKQIFQAAQSKKSLSDIYKFRATGDPFEDLSNLEKISSFGEEETPTSATTTTTATKAARKKTSTGTTSSAYFSYFPQEALTTEEEEESSSPVKINRGTDILNQFRAKLKLPSNKTTSSSFGLSDPFSDSFFGSF